MRFLSSDGEQFWKASTIFFLYCQFDFHWIILLCAPDYNSDCLGPHHEWNPTLRHESRDGRLINSHPIYLSFQQIVCHCVFTCTHVDDSLKEKNLQQTFISINILHLSYNGDLKNLSSFDFKIIHYIHFESTHDP